MFAAVRPSAGAPQGVTDTVATTSRTATLHGGCLRAVRTLRPQPCGASRTAAGEDAGKTPSPACDRRWTRSDRGRYPAGAAQA